MASRKEGITFYLLLFLSRGKLFCIYVVEKPSETQKGFSHDFRITLHCNAPLGRAAKHHLHLKKYATFFRSIVAPKTGLLLLSLFFALRKSLLLNFRKVYDGSRLSKPLACYSIAFELCHCRSGNGVHFHGVVVAYIQSQCIFNAQINSI